MLEWLVLVGCQGRPVAHAADLEAEMLSYEATGCDGWSRAGHVLAGGDIDDAVVLPDGRVFLVGSSPKSAQIFDPRTREVAAVADGPWRFLAGGDGVVLDDDELLLVGGQYVEPLPERARAVTEPVCYVLDWSADEWEPIACPSLWLADVGSRPHVTRLADGRVIAFDGVYGVAEFAVSTREWTNEVRTRQPIAGNSILALDDHRLIAIGGSAVSGSGSALAFVYDADARTWALAGAPLLSVFGSELVLLPDDRVLAFPGVKSTTSSTAIYDASANTWTPGPATAIVRSQAGVAKLGDGSILIVGGWDANLRRVPFAEVLRPGASAWELAGTNCVASKDPVLVDTVAGAFLFGGLEADGARESSGGFSFAMRNTVRIEHWDLTPDDLPPALALPPRTLAALEPGMSSPASQAWVGQPFPDLQVDVAGDRRHLSSWTGVRVVDVWATWCSPCLKSLPVLDDVARRWGPKGVATVLVSVDDDIQKIKNFDSGIHHATLAWSRDAANELGLGGIPAVFVIDAEGRVLAQHSGSVSLRKWLDAELAKATQ